MTSEYIEPLNLKYIFQNLLAGSPEIFMGIFFIALSVLAGKFKMNGVIYLLLTGLSAILLYNWFGGGFYLIIIVLGGLLSYYIISRLVK